MKRILALLLIYTFLSSIAMASSDDKVVFKGRVLASRQMDGVEFITFIENREYFLFRTEVIQWSSLP